MINTLIANNLSIINQLVGLLETLPSAHYQQSLNALHGSSLGQHTRHIVEFYQCLMEGIADGQINYDARERRLDIETNQYFALEILEKLSQKLATLTTDKSMILWALVAGEDTVALPTSLFRELNYLIEHTIHHLAIIKIGITQSFEDFGISPNFGVAHSTLLYRQQA